MGVVYAAFDSELDRKVALKLIRPDSASRTSQVRLSREAQAMARVTHPNVIAVYDVGRVDDQVFIAMEFVDGTTLAQWAHQRPRALHEVLEIFVQAGRGLAAAHAAGLVHRDFKPDNVLIGRDGRVRVVDFGLARTGELNPTVADDSPSTPLMTPLTRTGALMGTPAYMPLEQLEGRIADARSDQFAFSVALYEALYGERPFSADSVEALTKEIASGTVRPMPRGAHVPLRVREVLLRGLAAAPEQRFASMDALLAALSGGQRSRRRWLIAAFALLLMTSLAVFARSRTQVCGGAAGKLVGLWDAERRRIVHEAFAATKKPFAETTFASAASMLDNYLGAWTRMHGEACTATRVRGEQSEEVMELRMECLDHRREEVHALVDLFAQADAPMVERATQAVRALPDLDECRNAEALRQVVRPPPNPEARARVAALRTRLAEAKAQMRAGRFVVARRIADAAVPDARALGYAPVLAESLLWSGMLQDRMGDTRAVVETLTAAITTAEAARADLVRGQALTELVYVSGIMLTLHAEAHRTYQLAKAALARAGGDALTELSLDRFEAGVLGVEEHFDEAIEIHKRVLARLSERFGSEDPEVATSLGDLGNVYGDKGDHAQAIALYQRALSILQKRYGSQYPDVANLWNNLGMEMIAIGDYGASVAALEKALAIREPLLGPDHRANGATLTKLGVAFMRLRQFEKARSILERAYSIKLRAVGPDHNSMSSTELALGELSLHLGALDVALAHAQHALTIREHFYRELPPVAEPLTLLGRIRMARHENREALELLERAVAIVEHHVTDPETLGSARFALARALWNMGRDLPRARALALAARDQVVAERTELHAWLAEHR
jgi:tetratricopeptide (TPR) repeat protein/predicted Ser/Thr protein kinase